MRIAFISHTAAGGTFRVGSHHLSREMSRRGHEVIHISTPVSLLHALRASTDPDVKARLQTAHAAYRDRDRVLQAVPRSLVPIRRAPRWLLKVEAGRQQRTLGAYAHSLDVVYLDQPLMVDLALRLAPRTLVYRPTDAHFDPRSRAAELIALEHSAGIAATSDKTLETVISGTPWSGPSTTIENGVEFDHFYRPVNVANTRGRVVYLGALDHRFDWELLRALASAHPNVQFDIAGPARSFTADSLPANVTLAGPVPYDSAGEWMSGAAVGLLPLSPDPGNAGRSPMKYYEYLASGLSVLATRVPALSARDSPNVWLYSDLADAIRQLPIALNASASDRAAGQRTAEEYSWATRAASLEAFTSTLPGARA